MVINLSPHLKDGTGRYTKDDRMIANPVISLPTLENAPLISNVGRARYEHQYPASSYSIYNGLTDPTSIVSPVYPNQEPTVDIAACRFGTSHYATT